MTTSPPAPQHRPADPASAVPVSAVPVSAIPAPAVPSSAVPASAASGSAVSGSAVPAALSVEGLTLRAGKRMIFEGVTFDVPAGSLAVLAGASGTGKTALALALAGRLVPTAGQASVLGHALPRHAGTVRRRVGFTGNDTVVPLDETLTVRHHVADALKLAGPWWKPAASRDQVDRVITTANTLLGALEEAFGEDPAAVPLRHARLHRSELVRDASPVARFTLGVVLALVPGPDVLVVDDVDRLRTADERRAAWAALLTVERTRREDSVPLTVVATCQDARELEGLGGAGPRISALPLRPAVVHVLGSEPGPAAVPEPPAPIPVSEIR
ncbi:ATP-binding cassette domain-containing protein [Arthrobacter sp. L77]|uniref:ATP-binding cassette domain-containing protein n=1 Tax=Arthrobacter sp. L77 TaxID=1496689 RepID=UPI0005BDF109|nr:ATP-binding cassette domain-containing protein [Arthrobacter sp. L77]